MKSGPDPLRLGAGNRGPITMATSILGTMPFLTFTMDYPEVMDDFFKLLTEKLVEYIRLLREETGVPDTGYWITDDNCCLVSLSNMTVGSTDVGRRLQGICSRTGAPSPPSL